MSQQIKHLNEDNVRTILKWINLSASIDEKIDDLNIRTDACYSSKKVTDYAQEIKHSLEQYIRSSINGLTHLKKKIVDVLPSDADSEENILYLVKDASVVDDVAYNQYLLIDGKLESLGNTSTDMSNYYNKDESDAKFALLTDLQTLIDMVGNASDLETTAKDTLVSAINEIKEGLDDCITKDVIVTTIDSTVTDSQVPSALGTKTYVDDLFNQIDLTTYYTKTEIDNDFLKKVDADGKYATITAVDGKVDKNKIVTALNNTVTDEQIPTAKAVYDKLSDLPTDSGSKCYTKLDELGITTPCTIKDIWDKMPSGSIAIVTADSLTVTDLDVIRIELKLSNGDAVYGILTVVKLNGRTTLEFRSARTTSAKYPDAFIGYCKGSDCTSIHWKQIATMDKLNYSTGEVVKKTDITTTIDSSSTDTQFPTARAVNELYLRGTCIDQSVIDKYGTEIIKYPFGRWYIDGNEIAGKFSDIPWGTACIIDITSPIINTRNPWDNTWAYRNYNAQTIENKGTFVRQIESRGTPGVLLDTGWQRVCITTVKDVPVTYINTFDDETYIKPNGTNLCSYYVSNGNCTVTLEVICLSTSISFNRVITGLPKSKTTLYVNAIDRMIPTNSGAKGIFQLLPGGALFVACDYGDKSVATDRKFYISFSYPVAE